MFCNRCSRALALSLLLVLLPASAARAGSPAERIERGASLVHEERFPEAERLLRSVLAADPAEPEAIYFLGRVYLETERITEAIRYFERMVAKHPKSSRVHQGLGEAYAVEAVHASVFRQLGLAREARRSLERAVALDPDNVEARVSLFEFYRHAPGVAGGSVERATAQAREVERRNPSRGRELRANLLRDQGRGEEALVQYRRAIAADPANHRARLSLALLHTERREFGAAFEVLDALLAREPGHRSALYQLGRNAALAGRRLSEGEAALRTYLRHPPRRNQPSHAWALYRLGMIQRRQGELASARYTLRQALRLDPGLEGARKALEEISSS